MPKKNPRKLCTLGQRETEFEFKSDVVRKYSQENKNQRLKNLFGSISLNQIQIRC